MKPKETVEPLSRNESEDSLQSPTGKRNKPIFVPQPPVDHEMAKRKLEDGFVLLQQM